MNRRNINNNFSGVAFQKKRHIVKWRNLHKAKLYAIWIVYSKNNEPGILFDEFCVKMFDHHSIIKGKLKFHPIEVEHNHL